MITIKSKNLSSLFLQSNHQHHIKVDYKRVERESCVFSLLQAIKRLNKGEVEDSAVKEVWHCISDAVI